MKRAVLSLLLALFTLPLFAQLQTITGKDIPFQPVDFNRVDDFQLNKKSSANPKVCGVDSVKYGFYKATGYSWISISKGYDLGQFHEAPDTVTITGFQFYAMRVKNDGNTTAVYCHLYAASSDSLPTGSPIRSDTVYVDTTFGGGLFDSLRYHASWAPFKTTQPYILVVGTNDTDRVGIVTNSYAYKDGRRENLACGTVGGTWYNALNLNISGTTLDCDVFLEPHVQYKLYNDFTFKDCYKTYDSVHFVNKSSPIFFSKMYNYYQFRSNPRFNHRWDYGVGYFQYGQNESGMSIYTSYQNRTVRMISTLYQYSIYGRCVDTTIKELHFQPIPIKFSGVPSPICSGDSIQVLTGSNGDVKWFHEPFDTAPYHIGATYNTPPLYANDTSYVRAYNSGCSSIVARLELKVNQKPSLISTHNDSVCANSMANLAAYSDIGTVRWYTDSTSSTPVFTGNVLQVGPLSSDTAFYAQSYNLGCFSTERKQVRALVSNDFAPASPVTSNDTNICLLSGELILRAIASDSVRWFDVPSGGQAIHRGDSFVFKPTMKGSNTLFVDAFNGTCASSRLAINVQVDHFETVSDQLQKTCFGNTLEADYRHLEGGVLWYNADSSYFTDTKYMIASEPGTHQYLIQPYMGNCRDTALHKVILIVHSLPVIHVDENDGACRGTQGVIKLVDNGADYDWTYNGDPVGKGLTITTPPLYLNRTYQVKAIRNGCESDTSISVLVLKTPNANFDYQATWRNVDFVARDLSLAQYYWIMDDGKYYTTPQFTHYYAQDGDYKVSLIGTGENGCKDTISKPVSINTVSVEDLESNHKIWPNPSDGIFNLELPSNQQNTEIQLYDLSGRKMEVLTENHGSVYTIDMRTFTTGTYVIRLILDEQVYNIKVVKY